MQNSSGLTPVEFNCIVLQDGVQEKVGSLYIPEDVQERKKYAQTRGVLVAVSAYAFNEDIWPAGVDRPKPGDRVAWVKHAGSFVEGVDGVEYRVMKDKDIVAMVAADV